MAEEAAAPPAERQGDAKAAPPEKRHVDFVGCAKGKYEWTDTSNKKDADADIAGFLITKYSWSDGKKAVSVYVAMDGLDAVPDGALSCESGQRKASLTIAAIGTPPRRKVLRLPHLSGDIDGVKLVRRPGKDTVVLKLQKREERPWKELLEGGAAGSRG
mmetsp:Transcript_41975/g.110897  ORF Transcript_41975/g.110897 Transcript_41975/m.110897 type:complete len:159 (-) Transcript_41975:30-506(-)